jgi:hypothetical protein
MCCLGFELPVGPVSSCCVSAHGEVSPICTPSLWQTHQPEQNPRCAEPLQRHHANETCTSVTGEDTDTRVESSYMTSVPQFTRTQTCQTKQTARHMANISNTQINTFHAFQNRGFNLVNIYENSTDIHLHPLYTLKIDAQVNVHRYPYQRLTCSSGVKKVLLSVCDEH